MICPPRPTWRIRPPKRSGLGSAGAGLGSLRFRGSLSFALVIAGLVALPVNPWLITRGRGHAVVHQTGIHGGPSPRIVGAVAAVAFVFGVGVLVAELLGAGGGGDGHDGMVTSASQSGPRPSID